MEGVDRQLDLRWQYAAYFMICLLALGCTVVLLSLPGAYFRRYFGEINPLAVVAGASIMGAAALSVLKSSDQFAILTGARTLRGIGLTAVLSTALAVVVVMADLILRYPQDINVPVPQALLFYPAIGFVAEIAFHALPLTGVLLALQPLAKRLGREFITWLGILVVSLSEPTYQLLAAGKAFTAIAVYTWFHIAVIAFLQLYVFKRFDFVSMYVFRLFYYAYWHVLWGAIRLEVLF